MISINVAKLNETVTFDEQALPAESVKYALVYGLTQSINDVHAAVARKNYETDAAFLEAVRAKVEKRVAQIMSGDVPGTRAPADPKLATARALAKELSESELEEVKAFIAKKRAKAKAA